MAVTLGAVPFAANAEEEIIYGTMNISYSDFYAAEFGESLNAYSGATYSSEAIKSAVRTAMENARK